jgi:hypothetical protein
MKKLILILLLIPLCFKAADPPFKFTKIDDKAWHVYAGIGSAYLFGGYIYHKTQITWIAVGSGALFAGSLAVAKERIYDYRMGKGVCSNSDAYHTFWGAAIGAMALRITIDMKQKHDIEKEYFNNLRDSLFIEKLTNFKD